MNITKFDSHLHLEFDQCLPKEDKNMKKLLGKQVQSSKTKCLSNEV